MSQLFFLIFIFSLISCGIKGKPLPPVELTTQEAEAHPTKALQK